MMQCNLMNLFTTVKSSPSFHYNTQLDSSTKQLGFTGLLCKHTFHKSPTKKKKHRAVLLFYGIMGEMQNEHVYYLSHRHQNNPVCMKTDILNINFSLCVFVCVCSSSEFLLLFKLLDGFTSVRIYLPSGKLGVQFIHTH